ncbi:MAG: hypothetical protein HW380_100 [Magnetococcales bacterium]|nr:hypothetical protein [Magnetococcales bacterium]
MPAFVRWDRKPEVHYESQGIGKENLQGLQND